MWWQSGGYSRCAISSSSKSIVLYGLRKLDDLLIKSRMCYFFLHFLCIVRCQYRSWRLISFAEILCRITSLYAKRYTFRWEIKWRIILQWPSCGWREYSCTACRYLGERTHLRNTIFGLCVSIWHRSRNIKSSFSAGNSIRLIFNHSAPKILVLKGKASHKTTMNGD